MGLLLRVTDVRPDRMGWRWLLTDPDAGALLADHTVSLDPASPEVDAFRDLYRYLRWNADPGRRADHEAELITRVGNWLGRQVLGEALGHSLVAAAPVTVRVDVPPEAEFLLFRPMELAYVDGVPLPQHGVSLIFDVGGPGMAIEPVSGRLRMTAVFSLPTQEKALALRRERYALTRLIRRLGARRAIDLRVLQYGVTRERVREAIIEQMPDVLHISAHGSTGELVLETVDGSADTVAADDLLGLLTPAQGRIKLAVMSACESAAATIAETAGLLGLTKVAAQAEQQALVDTPSMNETGIAHKLARTLGCAVVAMRYPVHDEFAIALANQLYDGLYRLSLPLDRVLPRAVSAAAGRAPSRSRPAISVATPTLFGAVAAGLFLPPPPGEVSPASDEPKMSAFPAEPERFVGRAEAMAEAAAALAPGSCHTAVLFYGMAGAGKTACGLELAYRHEDAFTTLAFWQAPTRNDEFGTAMTSLALALEQQLDRHQFTMVDKITTVDSVRDFLPRLTALLTQRRLLLVLDNLETLLTLDGTWRDPRWIELIAALTHHDGESRVVLTSRTRPNDLDNRVLPAPVHALSRDESLVLARELPNLRGLLHLGPAQLRSRSTEAHADRTTVAEVLRLVQGHPKLLELADAASADREKLKEHLFAARAAARQQAAPLEAFFQQGNSNMDAKHFLHVLTSWTSSLVATLGDNCRLLLQFLCLLEDDDRNPYVVAGTWADLWQRLNRPGPAPPAADPLQSLIAAALLHPESLPTAGQGEPRTRYQIHPGVADTVRTSATEELRTAVDTTLAAWWTALAEQARTCDDGENTATVVQAGLSAAPYLLRLHEWDVAAVLLEHAHHRDQSPPVVQAVLPQFHYIAATTGNPRDAGVYARALATLDPHLAEQLLRQILNVTATTGDQTTADTVNGLLADLLRDTGRLDEALAATDRIAEQADKAKTGPWTQLARRGRRLQILSQMGQAEQVLAEVNTMRAEIAQLPDELGSNETAVPWDVREATLILGVNAANALGRWQQALDLNAEALASMRARAAGPYELTRTQFSDHGPLLRLGCIDEADILLRACQQAFENHQDTLWLGRVLSARASVADRRGYPSQAVELEQAALRLKYIHRDPDTVATSHHNLAVSLARTMNDPAGQVAHRLAAALIWQLAGMQRDHADSLLGLARDLHSLGDQASVPTTMTELAKRVERIDGVQFAAMIASLAPNPKTAQTMLEQTLQAATTHADEST